MMRLSGPKNETCPDNFRYTFPDGTVIRQSVYSDWLNKIADHYRYNEIPRPENWVQIAEDQLCHLLPPGWCKYDDGTNVLSHINTRLEMGDLFRGMEVLAAITVSSDPLVPQAEAERRGAICAGCYVNIEIPGCMPCMKIPDMIVRINGGKTTPSDPYLRSCGICKCHNQAQIWVKEEILAKGITQDQHDKFQMVPHCWKRDILPA